MSEAATLLSTSRCFGGEVRKYEHVSQSFGGLNAKFSVFLPPKALQEEGHQSPVFLWLSGLTCNEDNFMQKAGAQRVAAALDIVLVCPDTSPRGAGVEGEDESWDLGTGAGFYTDANTEKWAPHYQCYTYYAEELMNAVGRTLPCVDTTRISISGHSMGGHGALVLFLRNPGKYYSCSALAPICEPMHCPWGHKCFSAYLSEKDQWLRYDACHLLKRYSAPTPKLPILVHQGGADGFASQLRTSSLIEAANQSNVDVSVHMCSGYGHGYDFVATFIEQHLRHAAAALANSKHKS